MIFQIIENYLDPILKHLDPSLFQNITLGVLAIFIPFAIVFLTDILNSKKEAKSEFEKMVLSDEVLGARKIFWLAIVSIVFFAFFSGDKVSIYAKIVSIIAALGLVTLFWMPFKNILRFSEGHKSEFEILFLKKIRFSKILKFRNKVKAEKMVRAWSSFWSEKTDFNERDFTKIFIHHIDDSIKHKKFELAIQLAQTYVHNVDKRDGFLVSYEILPKVFEWNEKLWSEQQAWSKNYKLEKRIQNFFPQKYFTAVGSWLLKMYKKINPYKDHFWKWNYFGADFFKELVKVLLKDRHNPYQLFLSFKTHAEESVNKLNKIEDKKEKQEYDRYITGLFSSFCPIFFSEVGNAPSAHEIWDHYFPEEWKISMTNRKSEVSRIILHEFLQWSRDRIFKNDDNLTEAISGIFQNVHPSLFTSFLMLFFSEEIKNAVGKEPNFYILGTSVSWVSSAGEAEEDEGKRITELMNAKSESQKEETIGIILNFFTPHWDKLKITLDNDNKEEWKNSDDSNRKLMLKAAREEKLGKLKLEIESNEVKGVCKDDEQKELYRKGFLELIELLLKELDG